jgi:hypothetical protein
LEAGLLDLLCSVGIACQFLVGAVGSAVNFDHQPSGDANEVGHEAAEHVLAPKFQPGQAPAAKQIPDTIFGSRLVLSKLARPLAREPVSSHA